MSDLTRETTTRFGTPIIVDGLVLIGHKPDGTPVLIFSGHLQHVQYGPLPQNPDMSQVFAVVQQGAYEIGDSIQYRVFRDLIADFERNKPSALRDPNTPSA